MELSEHAKKTLRGILDGNEDHKIRTIAGLIGDTSDDSEKEAQLNEAVVRGMRNAAGASITGQGYHGS